MFFEIVITILISFLASNFNLANFVNQSDYRMVVEKQKTNHLPVRKIDAAEIDLLADRAAVLDIKNNLFIFEKNANEVAPLASITKLMTALVFLDHNPGWETIYEIKREDRVDGGKIYLYLGEKVTIKELFQAMLIGSDNTAAVALIRSTGLSESDFIKAMNDKATSLGLSNTKFSDVVGLSDENVSTAKEIAVLANKALSQPDILNTVSLSKVEFKTIAGKPKTIESTNFLLDNFSDKNLKIIGGKTGHTEAAGYCLVAKFSDNFQHEIISVVLKSPSENERFRQMTKLVEWIFSSFTWQ